MLLSMCVVVVLMARPVVIGNTGVVGDSIAWLKEVLAMKFFLMVSCLVA